MILCVGLGNPGGKYAGNRHNAGFHALSEIADAHGFGPARKKFSGQLREGEIGGEKAILLFPETFYNDSGNAVGAAAKFYKLSPNQVIVLHDEIDLAPGKVRVKFGGGLAGNNGLRSTAAHIGPDFWRVRIGIGHPGHKDAVTPFVLGDFSKHERSKYYDDLLEDMARAFPHLAPPTDEGAGRFMSALVQPGASAAPKEKTSGTVSRGAAKGSPAPQQASEQSNKKRGTSPFDVLKGLRNEDR